MASFYGRQSTTDQGTTQTTPKVATVSSCQKTCERMLNQCYSDATNFAEKERCRDRYDTCYDKCGALEEQPITRQITPEPSPQVTGPLAGAVGGTDRDRGREGDSCRATVGCMAGLTCINGICKKTVGPNPLPEPDPYGNPCMAACREDRRVCYQENRARGKDTTICDLYFTRCQNKCGGSPNPPLPGKCYEGQACSDTSDCAGKPCVKGKCQCTQVCTEGVACTDSKQCAGLPCINGKCHCTGGGCKDDAYCITKHGAGWYCYKTAGSDRGICKQKGAGDCTSGKRCTGPEKGNSQCGGLKCFRPKGWSGDEKVAGTCYCKTGDGDGDGDGGGEYQWPSELTGVYGKLMGKAGDYLDMDLPNYALSPELQALLDQLLGRAGEYMARKPGYSQSALDAMFGKDYENIRNLGESTRQQTLADLQREGMLGTGAGTAALRQIPWQTEKSVSETVRDVFLANEDQKRKDLESYTNMASGLFGQGVGVEQIVEAINSGRRGEERDYTTIANQLFGSGMTYNQLLESMNAARRGEGQNSLALYLQYVMSLMNSWKS